MRGDPWQSGLDFYPAILDIGMCHAGAELAKWRFDLFYKSR